MAIPAHRLKLYIDTLVKRTGISPEAAEQALLRTGKMPNVPDELFSAVSNYDVMGMSGMPEQEALKNLYLDHFDISGSGQPRSTLKTGDIRQIAPQAKPLDTVSQSSSPAPAARTPVATPAPKVQSASVASAPTKVSTTPAPGGRVAAGFRYEQPAAVAQPPIRVGMPGTNTSRLAGEVVESSPGMLEYISNFFQGRGTQAKDAIKGATQGAKNMGQGATAAASNAIAKNAGRLALGGTVLSVLNAAGEFNDPDDPVLRNTAEFVGNLTGGIGGGLGGGLIGQALIPIPGVGFAIGSTLGSIYGSDALSNIGGGLYDLVNDESPADRARKDALANAAVRREIAVKDAEAQLPLMVDQMKAMRADAFARAERDLAIQNEYNYANAANQMLVNGQQQRNLQALATTQYLLG